MNLADIRKKAEESRLSATVVPVEVSKEPALLPEIEVTDTSFFQEPSIHSSEAERVDVTDETFAFDNQTLERDYPLPEVSSGRVTPPLEPPPEQFSYVPVVVDTVQEERQSLPPAALPAVKKQAGYNALETILAGRESAAEDDGSATSQAYKNASEEVEEYLCFRVAHEAYAISIMAIKEIVKPRDVTAVPRMPAFILGVISLRGIIIPVMDMRLRLSLPVSPATGRERIIVLRMDSGFCGILVDEVIQVARIIKSCIEDPPAVLDGIDRDFVTGLGHFDNRMLIILNLGAILDIDVH